MRRKRASLDNLAREHVVRNMTYLGVPLASTTAGAVLSGAYAKPNRRREAAELGAYNSALGSVLLGAVGAAVGSGVQKIVNKALGPAGELTKKTWLPAGVLTLVLL